MSKICSELWWKNLFFQKKKLLNLQDFDREIEVKVNIPENKEKNWKHIMQMS